MWLYYFFFLVLLALGLFALFSINFTYYDVKNVSAEPGVITHRSIQPVEFNKMEKGYYPMNASILATDTGYLLYTRVSNRCTCDLFDVFNVSLYHTEIDGYLLITTLDKTFTPLKTTRHDVYISETEHLQDIRAFSYGGTVWYTGAYRNLLNNFAPFVTNNLTDSSSLIKLYKQGESIYQFPEKNWMPLVYNNEIYFVPSYYPLTVLRPDLTTGECRTVYKDTVKESKYSQWRGNTPFLYVPEENSYIGVVHTCNGNMVLGKNYKHYFIRVSFDGARLKILSVSPSLCLLGNCGIEFVLGLIEHHDKKHYILSYGKTDTSTNISIIPKTLVNQWLDRPGERAYICE